MLLAGCLTSADNEVVVYCALDKEFSQPILEDIGDELDLTVLPKFDQESNKTVSLVTSIINEQSRPRCDVFWNNEILHTLRLEQLGLLETFRSDQADRFPRSFVSTNNQWHGFAARARVLIVNTELLPETGSRPDSVQDLVNPEWKSRCAVAKPFFGTTATHAAVLFATMGHDEATDFFRRLYENAAIEGGNRQVARKVANGQYAFGLTDTDDAMIEIERGSPVAIVFPDQQHNQSGALLIPNTLAIIRGAPNVARAKALVDRLLAGDIEQRLSDGPSAQIPLGTGVDVESRLVEMADLKKMEVDFEAAALVWPKSQEALLEIFEQ